VLDVDVQRFLLSSPCLRSLQLGGCHSLTNQGCSLFNVAIKQSGASLSSLSLYWCPQLGDVGIAAFTPCLSNLRTLCLSGVRHLTDSSLIPIIQQNHHSLTDLDLTRVERTSDSLLRVIGGCSHLLSLSLYAANQYTDVGLMSLNSNQSLTQLDLTGLCLITDNSILSIAQNQRELRQLTLQWSHVHLCSSPLAAVSAAILLFCSILLYCALFRCIRLTDSSLKAISAGLPQLRQLSLHGCTLVTDVGLAALSDGLRHLSSLDLNGCRGIERKDRDFLLTRFPNLLIQ